MQAIARLTRFPVTDSIGQNDEKFRRVEWLAGTEKLAGKFVYPEWDWKKATLVPEQARVLENIAAYSPAAEYTLTGTGARNV